MLPELFWPFSIKFALQIKLKNCCICAEIFWIVSNSKHNNHANKRFNLHFAMKRTICLFHYKDDDIYTVSAYQLFTAAMSRKAQMYPSSPI